MGKDGVFEAMVRFMKKRAKLGWVVSEGYTKAAVDFSIVLHKAMRRFADRIIENERDQAIDGCIQFFNEWLVVLFNQGIMHVHFVLDGPSPAAKHETNVTREKARQQALSTIATITKANMSYEKYKELCQHAAKRETWLEEGIIAGFIQVGNIYGADKVVSFQRAPSEADMQIAWLVRHNIYHFAITEDQDYVLHGCPRIMFKLNFWPWRYAHDELDWLDTSHWLPDAKLPMCDPCNLLALPAPKCRLCGSAVGLTPEDFLNASCLGKTDYWHGLRGFALLTACKAIRKEPDMQKHLSSMSSEDKVGCQVALDAFKLAVVHDQTNQLVCLHASSACQGSPTPPQPDFIHPEEILVDQNVPDLNMGHKSMPQRTPEQRVQLLSEKYLFYDDVSPTEIMDRVKLKHLLCVTPKDIPGSSFFSSYKNPTDGKIVYMTPLEQLNNFEQLLRTKPPRLSEMKGYVISRKIKQSLPLKETTEAVLCFMKDEVDENRFLVKDFADGFYEKKRLKSLALDKILTITNAPGVVPADFPSDADLRWDYMKKEDIASIDTHSTLWYWHDMFFGETSKGQIMKALIKFESGQAYDIQGFVTGSSFFFRFRSGRSYKKGQVQVYLAFLLSDSGDVSPELVGAKCTGCPVGEHYACNHIMNFLVTLIHFQCGHVIAGSPGEGTKSWLQKNSEKNRFIPVQPIRTVSILSDGGKLCGMPGRREGAPPLTENFTAFFHHMHEQRTKNPDHIDVDRELIFELHFKTRLPDQFHGQSLVG